MTARAKLLALAALAAAGFLAAGRPKAPERHSTTGVIREIQDEGRRLTIEHQDFPGFMEAMTMDFQVKDPALTRGLRVGDRVRFTVTNEDDDWPITAIEKRPPLRKRP